MKRNISEKLQPGNKRARTESLHKAAKRGDIAQAKYLLENGFDVNSRFEGLRTGHTPLDDACIYLNIEMAKVLLEHGADPNIKAGSLEDITETETPMLSAIRAYLLYHEISSKNHSAQNEIDTQIAFFKLKNIINLLLDYGATLNIISEDWRCIPLFVAIQHLDTQLLEFLLDKGADPNIQAQIIDLNDPIESFVNSLVYPDLYLDTRYKFSTNLTPLNFVLGINLNNLDLNDYWLKQNEQAIIFMTHLLLMKGANPNIYDQFKKTALDYLSFNISFNNALTKTLTKLLLKYGLDPDITPYAGIRLFQSIAIVGNQYLGKAFLKAGADPSLLEDNECNIPIKLNEIPTHSLAEKFPEAKSCTQIKFQIKNICKAIGLFNRISKNGFCHYIYLPEDVLCLIKTFYSNVSTSAFNVVTKELKEVETNICLLKEKADRIFLSLKSKGEKIVEIASER
ncbi:MAG: ankyrin repeat domain-containing protein [Candidatus Jidaibacter sp.]|jgi:ankyrin repeat protein|nr:ankyrin repeat domain-containing protein [Candidatus Jidaibacter sp.]